jgi:type I restriction enzyme, S subunit
MRLTILSCQPDAGETVLTHKHASILGPIPEKWSTIPLRGAIIREDSIAGDWGDDSGPVALNVLRSTNFTNDGHFDLSDVAVRYFSTPKAEQLNLKTSDVLLERSGGGPEQPVGRILIAQEDMPGFGFGNFIQRLRPNVEVIIPSYLRWVLHEIHRSGVIERVQYQTTQMRNLDFRDYQRLILPLPPRDEQQKIAALIDRCDNLILLSKRMLGIRGSIHRDDMQGPLNTMKTSLLQNLLTGQTVLTGRLDI